MKYVFIAYVLSLSPLSGPSPAGWASLKAFDSLAACVEYVEQNVGPSRHPVECRAQEPERSEVPQ